MKIVKSPNTENILKIMSERINVDDKVLVPNSTEASFEKHMPEISVNGNTAVIRINHPMDRDHYIEWIIVDYGELEITKYFKPFDIPTITTNYQKNMKVYAYCNQHGLWMNESK